MKKPFIALVVVAGISLVVGAVIAFNKETAQAPGKAQQSTKTTSPKTSDQAVAKPNLDDPTSLQVIVNKKRPLPAGFAPPDLVMPPVKLRLGPAEEQMKIRRPVNDALIQMFAAAQRDSVVLVFGSGYRSEALQKQFYNQYVAQSGQPAADTFSARPGYSEHQTGLAIDINSGTGGCHLEICFKDTAEGKWLQLHAATYGFVIRYPEGKQAITGYQYEPWHLRYVGRELATKIRQSNKTLEEYFGLSPAAQY